MNLPKPNKIHVRCLKCKRMKLNQDRDECLDPDDAVIVEVICPKCDDGDFHLEIYYDKDGNVIEDEYRLTK